MSDTVADSIPPARELNYFEQQIFARSPLGILPTTLVLLAILYGSYLLFANLENIATIRLRGMVPVFAPGAWPALVLSLVICTVLAMQRYTRLAELRDFDAYAAVLKDGTAGAQEATSFTPDNARLVVATLIGIVLGGGVTILIFTQEARAMIKNTPLLFGWFLFTITTLVVMFIRGVELTRKANSGFRKMLNNGVRIDLLRIDALDVLGRSSARAALVWFTVSAVICLFFVGGSGDNSLSTIITLVACAAMGIWIFIRNVHRVHTLIMGAKRTELERVRREIDNARAGLHTSTDAATRVQGLLAYEARIQAAPEWPFDQAILVRFGASALILTVPWFGQAIAAALVEHLGAH